MTNEDKQAVLAIINFENEWLFDANSHNADTKIAFSTIKSKIAEMPSCTLSRTRGKWIINKNDDAGEGFYICSNCKNDVYNITDFCPNCGADMRERADKE